MANHALSPLRLNRLLSELTVAQALVVDAIRGRSIRETDVATLRQTVSGIHKVLRDLDTTRPWDPPAPPPDPEVEPNPSPRVDAGVDQMVEVPSALLAGTALDDEVLATNWNQASGPAPAIFNDAAALSTTVTFSLAGTYVLRLTAFDGVSTAYDELTVEVVI